MTLVSPVFAQPATLRCPFGPLWVWYCSPAGAVVQMMEACVFSREMAEWMVGPAHATFSEHFGHQAQLRLLLDLRPMTSREPTVRAVIMEAGSRILHTFSHVRVVQPHKPQPLYMVTLKAAAALLSAFGPEVHIDASFDEALAALSLQAEVAL